MATGSGLERSKQQCDDYVPRGIRATFASLRNTSFRLYFAAQIASNIGTWIQITAENWLVLTLTDSGLALGITNALQFGPLVLFGLYGGVLADRFDRRRLLIVTQSVQALLALAMGVLIVVGRVELWMIWAIAFAFGLVTAIDKPALHGFIKDLVGEGDLPNAIALNNVVISAGRMIGPVISGFLIAGFGMAPSFFFNTVSFGLVVLVLLMLNASHLHTTDKAERRPGQVREGLSYIRRDRVLAPTVIAMSVIFIAAYNLQVLVPLVTVRVLGGSSEQFGALMSALGFGAVVGSLVIAAWVKPGLRMIVMWCALLAIVYVWLALPFGTYFVFAGMFLLGVACGFFSITVASTLQLSARDDMRGRVMAVYSIGILGSSLIGAPLFGASVDAIGVPRTFLMVAAICAGTAAWAWVRSAKGFDS